jgi:hypothetical protein
METLVSNVDEQRCVKLATRSHLSYAPPPSFPTPHHHSYHD